MTAATNTTDLQERFGAADRERDGAHAAWSQAFKRYRAAQTAALALARQYADALAAEIEAAKALEIAHERVRTAMATHAGVMAEVGELAPPRGLFWRKR